MTRFRTRATMHPDHRNSRYEKQQAQSEPEHCREPILTGDFAVGNGS